MNLISKYTLIILIVLFSGSCGQKQTDQILNVDSEDIGRIAVFAFQKSNSIENIDNVDLFEFTEYFYFSLKQKLDNKLLVEYSKISREFDLLRNKKPDYSYNQLLNEISKSNNAEFYISGFIKEYKERVGSDLGVSSPASVDIEIELVNVKTGQIIWSYRFNQSQLPLLYDISRIKKFIKRKGKWITADSLLKEGLDESAINLNNFLRKKN
ncbi:MAG: hypothetical protein GTO02_07200 [Candidatus Dadabacteria bacterium]|nr:hypothetical protein [Candidatus Dadabacteria bacterium]NIQ14182.1 hypothetical protein [Candidatus Dadabacteria bacterium]